MKPQTCKIKIKQLVKALGSRKKLADKLLVTERYIWYMEKGHKPSVRLYRDICQLHEEVVK